MSTPARAGRPGTVWKIATAFGTVRHVGTQFEVRIDDLGMQVSVREGVASLDREGQSHEARAGYRLVLDHASALTIEPAAVRGPRWDWTLEIAPPFEVENRSLGEFLDWVARETGDRVQFTDPAIEEAKRKIVLHGSASGLRPDEAPAAVLPTCGLRFRMQGDTMLIETTEPATTRD